MPFGKSKIGRTFKSGTRSSNKNKACSRSTVHPSHKRYKPSRHNSSSPEGDANTNSSEIHSEPASVNDSNMISDQPIQTPVLTNNLQHGYKHNEYKFKNYHAQKLKDIIFLNNDFTLKQRA